VNRRAQQEEVGEHTASKDGKPQWKKPLEIPKQIYKDNIKINL
jgi:hypothetical protein